MPPPTGADTPRTTEVPDALVDCHHRLRKVTALATALDKGPGATAEEVLEVAAKLHRYFTMALPLHEEDEDRSLFPRVLDVAPELAPTIALLRADHHRLGPPVTRLVALCGQLRARPDLAPQLTGALAAAAEAVVTSWQDHMAIEEREVFPAARRLSPALRTAIAEEMGARRAQLPP